MDADFSVLFSSWAPLGRVLIVGPLAYFGLVAMLRISGKRTLSKMNAFDLIVTVALGSVLANLLLSPDVALAEGLLGLGLLIVLQYLMAWMSRRSSRFESLIKATPSLLIYRGQLQHETLKRERVTVSEVRAALRERGVASFEEVEAAILETDGNVTLLQKSAARQIDDLTRPGAVLHGVRGPSS